MDFLNDLDLGDRNTQIIVAGVVLIGGYLLMRGRGSTSTVETEPTETRTFVIEDADAFGTRADVQGNEGRGVFGWVGNNPVPETPADDKEPEPEPETEPEPVEDTLRLTLRESVVDAGGRVYVGVKGGESRMNDVIDVYMNNTTTAPLRSFTISANGAASGYISFPQRTFEGGQTFTNASLVAINRRSGEQAQASVRIQKPAGRGGDTSVRMIGVPKTGVSPNPVPLVINDVEPIHAGESLRSFSRRVYGYDDGVELVRTLNPDIDTDNLNAGTRLRVK